MRTRWWGEAEIAEWIALDQGGWEYLLPSGRDARWLCVDALKGSTTTYLAPLCRELHVLAARPEDAAAIESQVALGLDNVRFHPAASPPSELRPRSFDGFVLHDLHGTLDEGQLVAWLRMAREAVHPDGFLYVSARNRYAYTRLRSAERVPCHRTRPQALLRAVDGERAIVHPFICDPGGRLLDVIPPTGYVSAKNPGKAGERFRRLMMGPRTARHFSPAFGIITRGARTPAPRLDALLSEIVERGRLQPGAAVIRYHVLPAGKVVVSLGAPARGFGDVIAVFARGPVAIERRDREFGMLERLNALPEPIARFIPKPYFRSEAAGTPAYVMQEFQGITLDAPVPQLEPATREAASFLQRLHVETRRTIDFDAAAFEQHCEPLLATARERYPPMGDVLDRIAGPMREWLIGLRLPLVWMHGDFKVENIIIDPRTSALVGVIDWEHTEPEGLPFIDLWYLLLYNQEIRHREHFFPAVGLLTSRRPLPPEAARACDEYAAALEVPSTAHRGLLAAFILHHIAKRLLYTPRDEARMREIAGFLEELLQWRS